MTTAELTPDQEQALDSLMQSIMVQLAQGTRQDKIVEELTRSDWDEDTARVLVTRAEEAVEEYRQSPEARSARSGKYAKHMLVGGLWALGGTVVTAATYNAASSGGTYVIAWGAILFGGIEFLIGLFGWMGQK